MIPKMSESYILILNHLYNYTASKDGFYSFSCTAIGISEATSLTKSSVYKWLNYLYAAELVKDDLARVRNIPLTKDGKTRRKTCWRCFSLTDEGRALIDRYREIWAKELVGREMVGGTVEA